MAKFLIWQLFWREWSGGIAKSELRGASRQGMNPLARMRGNGR